MNACEHRHHRRRLRLCLERAKEELPCSIFSKTPCEHRHHRRRLRLCLERAKEELPCSIFSKTQKKKVSNSVLRNIKALKDLRIFSAVKLGI